jgi:hypothetical protein
MNMAKTGFKITSQPLTPKDPSRNQVNVPTQQFRADDRNTVQAHIQRDNPKHYYSSALEANAPGQQQSRSDDLRRCNPDGPTRGSINHSHKVDRTSFHGNSGVKKGGHAFRGVRGPRG